MIIPLLRLAFTAFKMFGSNKKKRAGDPGPDSSYFSPDTEESFTARMAFFRERSGGSFFGFLLNIALRFLQFVFAIAVIGLYAQDLKKASDHGVGADSKWVRRQCSLLPHSSSSQNSPIQSCELYFDITNSLLFFAKAFAVAIGSLSAFTALVYGLIPVFLSSITVAIFAAWDIILFILWAAVFGLFGSMYIKEDPEMNGGIKRMKNAVWIDLINMLLWFVSAIIGAIGFWKWLKGGRSLHTGRAHV